MAEDLPVPKFSRLKQDKKFLDLVKNVEVEVESGRLDYKNDDIEQKTRFYQLIDKSNEAMQMLHPEIMSIHKTARDMF